MHKIKPNRDPRKYVPNYWKEKLLNTPENRFKIKCSPPDKSGCINWMGYLKPNGYGDIAVNGKKMYVHRLSYELFYEVKIPDKAYVAHRCDNRRCVNPHHLFLSSPKVNTRDMFSKERDRWSKTPILTKNQKKEIYLKISDGQKVAKLSKEYKISKSSCYKIFYKMEKEMK